MKFIKKVLSNPWLLWGIIINAIFTPFVIGGRFLSVSKSYENKMPNEGGVWENAEAFYQSYFAKFFQNSLFMSFIIITLYILFNMKKMNFQKIDRIIVGTLSALFILAIMDAAILINLGIIGMFKTDLYRFAESPILENILVILMIIIFPIFIYKNRKK